MNIAFCILTKNRADILLESSIHYFEEMASRNIDIYIYDSSDDTKTQSLVLAWNAKGYGNIYWVDCRFTVSADEKVPLVYSGFGFQKKYDYVWLSKDRIVLAAPFLDRILRTAESAPDVIMTGKEEDSYFYGVPKFADEYQEPRDFFRDFGAAATSWESVILRADTMLNGVDWEKYVRDYKIGPDNAFNQIVFLFARLSELEKPRIAVERPGFREKLFHSGSGSGWLPITMDLWGRRWPKAIGELPEIYNGYKAHVIKVETMHPNIFGSTDLMIRLKKMGYLTEENFSPLREKFDQLSDIPAAHIDFILGNDLTGLSKSVMEHFDRAMSEGDYFRAFWIHDTNSWMRSVFGEARYDELGAFFRQYRKEIGESGEK